MRKSGWVLLMAWFVSTAAAAQSGDVSDGEKLYEKECAICHSQISAAQTGEAAPAPSQLRRVHLAMAPSNDQIAVALGYGPPLRGVIGRPAGTMEAFQYSEAFLAKLKGKVWDEAMLDKWMASSQTMVPGTFMFYSQSKAEVRRLIIDYLKARP